MALPWQMASLGWAPHLRAVLVPVASLAMPVEEMPSYLLWEAEHLRLQMSECWSMKPPGLVHLLWEALELVETMTVRLATPEEMQLQVGSS